LPHTGSRGCALAALRLDQILITARVDDLATPRKTLRSRQESASYCASIQSRQDPRPFLTRLRTHLAASLLEQGPQGSFVMLNRCCLHGKLPGAAIESHMSSITPEVVTVICDHGDVLNPWQWCDADDDVVADFLAATVQGLIESGGWIHPEARIVARDGDLHIECPADEGTPLIRVPAAAMLPVTRARWNSGNSELSILGLDDWPEGADLPLLITQVGLHNACGKLPRLVATHPSASQTLSAEIIDAVRVLRPTFRTRTMSPTDVFWATRTFRLPAFAGEAQPVVLPVLDTLNHHPLGAVGQWHGGSFTVSVSRPTGTTECFLDYGHQRDALETALVYGFADTTTSIAHCGPLDVEVPGLAVVRILDQGRTPTGDLLPLRAERSGDVWSLNRFTFTSMDPSADLFAATGMPMRWCEEIYTALVGGYLAILDDLNSQLISAPPNPAVDVLLTATRHLRSVVTSSAR